MTHPTDEELDALVRKLEAQAYQQGRIARHAMIDAKSAITALRAQLAEAKADKERLGRELNLARYGQPDFSWQVHKEAMAAANARADRAEAALAAQIEMDARIAEEEGWVPGKPHLGITEREEGSRDCAERIAAAIRNQPHDRAALEAAHHVSETPKSEHDSADVLTAPPAPVTLAEVATAIGDLGDNLAYFPALAEHGLHRRAYELAADLRKCVKTEPASVTLDAALQVPEVQALVVAARKTILAAEMREAYHRLPNDRNRIGDPKSKKSKARDSWLKAFRRAALSADSALRAIEEGEA